MPKERDPFKGIASADTPVDTPTEAPDGVSAPDQGAAAGNGGAGARPSDGAYSVEAQESASLKRRMPDYLRRFLLRVQGGKLYLPAAQRLVWFRDECPDWGITTQLIEGGQEAGFATVRATVANQDGRVIASGIKTETRQDFPAGWVEKAETGAIARALAVAGFGTQFSPELDEGPLADSPQIAGCGNSTASAATHLPSNNIGATSAVAARTATPQVWEGPGQCPNCHAPTGKKHARNCSLAGG